VEHELAVVKVLIDIRIESYINCVTVLLFWKHDEWCDTSLYALTWNRVND